MSLLTMKVVPPPLRPELVPRGRLLARLDKALNYKVALITAPAGYGKTTLAATWLAQLPSTVRTGWLSVDEADNDLVRFLVYLAAALPLPQSSVRRTGGRRQDAPVRHSRHGNSAAGHTPHQAA